MEDEGTERGGGKEMGRREGNEERGKWKQGVRCRRKWEKEERMGREAGKGKRE